MFRTYQVFWNRLFQLIDAIIVVVSFLLAWELKFHSGIFTYGQHLMLSAYLPAIVIAVPLFLLSNWAAGLYKPMRSRTFWQETLAITRSVVIGLLIFMSFLYVTHMSAFSRAVLVIFAITFSVLTFFSHLTVRHILRTMRTRGYNKKFVLIVGWTPAISRFIDSLEHQPWFGYQILGLLSEGGDALFHAGLSRIGNVDQLPELLSQHLVDHVIIALPKSEEHRVTDIIGICERFGVQSLIVPDYFELLPAKPRFESFAGMPLIDTRYVPLDDAVNATLKRAFDILFSLLVLVFLSPLYLGIAVAVKLSSPGPVIFKQTRVGKNRRQFMMFKFRTMKYRGTVDPDDDIEWTTQADPRRTWLGSLLRKTSLDELPQFLNVLKGDMSVIGPRPERPMFVENFKSAVPRYMIKHRVRPGITGWAQVNGWRGDTSIDERIKCDLEYIERWSLSMDLKIFIVTLVRILSQKNAY